METDGLPHGHRVVVGAAAWGDFLQPALGDGPGCPGAETKRGREFRSVALPVWGHPWAGAPNCADPANELAEGIRVHVNAADFRVGAGVGDYLHSPSDCVVPGQPLGQSHGTSRAPGGASDIGSSPTNQRFGRAPDFSGNPCGLCGAGDRGIVVSRNSLSVYQAAGLPESGALGHGGSVRSAPFEPDDLRALDLSGCGAGLAL